jgi:hypothetical protein
MSLSTTGGAIPPSEGRVDASVSVRRGGGDASDKRTISPPPRFARTLPSRGGMRPPMSQVLSYGHFTTGGIDDRIESTLPPVLRPKIVPRS